jgi:hypothetical protein
MMTASHRMSQLEITAPTPILSYICSKVSHLNSISPKQANYQNIERIR